MQKIKTNLGIIFGGLSSEYTVSCLSAASVLRHLDQEKYHLHVIGITPAGQWFYYPDYDPDIIGNNQWQDQPTLIPAVISPDRSVHGLQLSDGGTVRLDGVFPVLHGWGGEDGAIQGLLELAGIPYVGCSIAASANCMDKSLAKLIISHTGIKQAHFYLVRRCDFQADTENVIATVIHKVGPFPVFVKPCSQGSSIGTSRASNPDELLAGLQEAFGYDDKVLVEEGIDGIEVECAILGNDNPIASAVGEIAPTQPFYTFDAKYHDHSSQLFIPARISEQQARFVREDALTVYQALGCRGLARVDFFCTATKGEIIFNEINTMPGFTATSMYPKLFEHSGLAYSGLLDRLIELAVEN